MKSNQNDQTWDNCPTCGEPVQPFHAHNGIAHAWHFVHCGYNHPSEQPRLTHEEAMERKAKRLEASMSSDWAAKKAAELLNLSTIDTDLVWQPAVYAALSGIIATALRDAEACGHMSGFDAARIQLAKGTPVVTIENPPGFRKPGMRIHVGGISWWLAMSSVADVAKAAAALRDAARVPGGVGMIAAERERQINEKEWTPEHDDGHVLSEMAKAAACYANPDRKMATHIYTPGFDELMETRGGGSVQVRVPVDWPWDAEWWNPSPDNRIRELVKAGALIAAEIDRLQRAALAQPTPARGENLCRSCGRHRDTHVGTQRSCFGGTGEIFTPARGEGE